MVHVDFDKPRKLHFDIETIEDLEIALDGRPLGLITAQLGQLSIHLMIVCLLYGFRHEDASLNKVLVRKMLQRYISAGKKLKVLADAISDALIESGIFGKKDDDELPEKDPADEGNA